MPRDCSLYLGDMMRCCESILEFTKGMTFADYEANSLIRAAVERKFTIIGEALRQLSSYYPDSLTPSRTGSRSSPFGIE